MNADSGRATGDGVVVAVVRARGCDAEVGRTTLRYPDHGDRRVRGRGDGSIANLRHHWNTSNGEGEQSGYLL